MAKKATKLSDDEIARRLSSLPRWRRDGDFICRRFETHGWKGTLMAINAVGHLCEAAWHHPDLAASYNWVEVRLQTHDAGGISARDFELAAKIEEFVAWRPAAESALEGTPADERHAYIKE